MIKRILAVAALSVLVAGGAWAADAVKGEWTGFITDTHCGARGATKAHTAACVEKCIKGGSRAQLWIESEKKGHDLEGFDKVKTLVGSQVTVTGTMNPETGAITVESAKAAAAK